MKRLFLFFGLALLLTPLLSTAAGASAYDCGDQKLVALTFDDGPGAYSDQILDILKSHNAKATFFLNGINVEWRQSQTRRIVSEGHQLANHSYTHPNLEDLAPEDAQKEIDNTSDLLVYITGTSGKNGLDFYFRAPYGKYKTITSMVNAPIIQWSVNSEDWNYEDGPAERLSEKVEPKIKDGDIVLLHETVLSTAHGLDKLIRALENDGFQCVTVEELLFRRGIEPVAGEIYSSAPNQGINRIGSDLYYDESKLNGHWAWPSINASLAQGYMKKNEAGEFLPNFPLTRGDLILGIARAAQADLSLYQNAEIPFTDIQKGTELAAAAAWGLEEGVMKGVAPDRFNPDGTMTRELLAMVMKNYIDPYGRSRFDLDDLSDADAVSEWAQEGVALCQSLGLMGPSDGYFYPKAVVDRALGAVVLQNMTGVERMLSQIETRGMTAAVVLTLLLFFLTSLLWQTPLFKQTPEGSRARLQPRRERGAQQGESVGLQTPPAV